MRKPIKAISLFIGALLLAACHHKPVNPPAPLINFTQTLPVKTVWTDSSGGGLHKEYLNLTPTVNGGQVYVASYGGQVTAINAQTGKKLWSTALGQAISSGVAVDDSRVYLGTKKAEVIALNRSNGKLLWKVPVSNEVLVKPNATAALLVVKASDDNLYALNKQNGETIWNYKEPSPDMILRGGQSPQVYGNNVIVGFADGQLAVFNLHDGNMLWKKPAAEAQGTSIVEQMLDVNSLAVADGTIYAGTYQGSLSAASIQTGESFWQQPLSSYSGLALDQRNIYITDSEGVVYAFNRHSGQILWQQDKLLHRGVTGPALLGNVVIVADSKGYVHYLSATNGEFLARTYTDSKGILASPVAGGNAVYVYTNSGRLVKYQWL